ncbi:hypothetical protein [Nitrosomonas ureae]|uniref:Uncharacterized protein n=2 Tax=Nitrosomonas ureae TaxID=44577 RepID=A0A0S3AFV7_9PROT|nr:hypothetical protein [Nitrosomonas ureae]ALQ50063.1 hypothetical protein ATY38_01690 [Nitrosomonas ureae]SDT89963.1 hypothetical protein SAMN05216406_1095 [Nitrosomonas ureae]SEP96634.1 hypothetical protein SAMN05421510_10132 [Nitrosomonas ureae]
MFSTAQIAFKLLGIIKNSLVCDFKYNLNYGDTDMKIFNLILMITVSLIFSTPLMSAAEQVADFPSEKNREIGNVKDRIQILEGRLNCMQKTNDFESLKTCNQAAAQKLDALETKIDAQERKIKQANNKTKQPDNKASDNKQPNNKKPETNNKPN